MPSSPRKRPPHNAKDSPERRKLFLEQLAAGRVPAVACKNCDLGYTTVQEWRREDPVFAAQWSEAVEEGVDLLEAEARRRAEEGHDRPVFQGGIKVGTERVYSDALMQTLLKGRRKQVFSERTEVTGADGGPQKMDIEVTFVSGKAKE